MTQEDPPASEERLVDSIGQLAFTTMGPLTAAAADAGLSLTQLRVLAILRDRRLRIGDLALYLGLEKSTMTGLVARAEKRGLMARETNEQDARAVDVVLTDEGRALARRLERDLHQHLAPRLANLTPDDQARLSRLLIRMLD